MWFGLVLGSAALFCSSFASQVSYERIANVSLLTQGALIQIWQLILLQGVFFGIGGGLVYMPAIMLLPEWFSQRRGLAAGIIFAGSGLGGASYPRGCPARLILMDSGILQSQALYSRP